MLRIDLLPSYVAQRRLTRQLTVLFVCILAAIVFLGTVVVVPLQQQIQQTSDAAATAEAFKKQADQLDSDTAAITAKAPPYLTKVQFFTDVRANNSNYPKLYRQLAKYTVPTILYSSMAVSGTSLSIAAYTPKLAELSNYLAHIWNDPDLKSVSVSAFPGYKEEYDPSSNDYTLPELPPGYQAHFKNSPILVKQFTVKGGIITNISSGNETGQPTPTLTNAKKPLFDAAHSGFDFTVSAVLKNAIPTVADPAGTG